MSSESPGQGLLVLNPGLGSSVKPTVGVLQLSGPKRCRLYMVPPNITGELVQVFPGGCPRVTCVTEVSAACT